jgi:hypothetical protein
MSTNARRLSFALTVIACAPLLVGQNGCNETSETRDRAVVQQQQTVYQEAQPIPTFDFSLERQVAIELYTARNQAVATHSVWRSQTGVIEGDCPSIGFPLPYDVQLTNPLQRAWPSDSAVIAQAEPNGLFTGTGGALGTWVRCVYAVAGRSVTAPVYVESLVTTYPFPVEVDYAANRVSPIAGQVPTVTISAQQP